MRRNNDFIAESIQIGKILRALSESNLGQLVFRDSDFPNGVRLKDFFTTQLLVDLSGSLGSRIDALETVVESLSGVSISGGDLTSLLFDVAANKSDIQDINTEIDGIDTEISNINSSLIGLSGSGESQVKVDNDGNLQRHGYSPIIGGKIDLDVSQVSYTVNDANISNMSNPVCTIVSPLSGAAIISHYIYEINNGSFKIELSTTPPISGYKLHWMSLENM